MNGAFYDASVSALNRPATATTVRTTTLPGAHLRQVVLGHRAQRQGRLTSIPDAITEAHGNGRQQTLRQVRPITMTLSDGIVSCGGSGDRAARCPPNVALLSVVVSWMNMSALRCCRGPRWYCGCRKSSAEGRTAALNPVQASAIL